MDYLYLENILSDRILNMFAEIMQDEEDDRNSIKEDYDAQIRREEASGIIIDAEYKEVIREEKKIDDRAAFSSDPITEVNALLDEIAGYDFTSLDDINELEYMDAMNTYYTKLIESEQLVTKSLNAMNILLNEESNLYIDPNTGEYLAFNEALDFNNVKQFIQQKWNMLLQFLEQLFKRFQEAITNILYSNKGYLDKYRTIILNTPWSNTQTFQYEGNYKVAITRCMNTPVPEFNYETYADSLRANGYGPAIQRFMAGKGFKYDESNNNLPNQFKSYFLALEYETTRGTFSQLNPREIFDFCYNINQITSIINKDRDTMKRGSNALLMAANKEIRLHSVKPNTNTEVKTNTNQVSNVSGTNNTGMNTTTGGTNTSTNVNASNVYIDDTGKWVTLNEADMKTDIIRSNPADNVSKSTTNPNTNLKISTDGQEMKSGSDQLKSPSLSSDMNNIMNKWTMLCKSLISAKLTALQKIGKDYMAIIRAHVKNTIQQQYNAKQQQAQNNNMNMQQQQQMQQM